MNDAWNSFVPSPRMRSAFDGGERTAPDQEEPLLSAAPLIDMVELPDGVCLYCNLPGATPGGISVTIDGKFLRIRAAALLPPIRGKIHALEFSDIVYEGGVLLPAVDEKHIEASFLDGVLRIFMPFPPETRPVRIPVSGR